MPGRSGPLGNFDLDEGPEAPPVSEQIIAALTANSGKVIDLFRSWDHDGDGVITRREFHKAMDLLGLEVPKAAIDTIFTRWDKDGGGELSLPEMTKILRAASTSQKGIQKLRDLLAKKGLKVSALFREWDTNGDGEIDREEFRKAIKYLGLNFPRETVDACFDSFDRDGNGFISHREFNKVLRRDVKAEEAAKKAREEAARIARELAAKVDPVDVKALRETVGQDLWRKLRHSAVKKESKMAAVVDAAMEAAEGGAHAPSDSPPPQPSPAPPAMPPSQTILSAKAKAIERDRLHMSLRLRGTDLPTPPGSHMRKNGSEGAVAVTRHSRRPRPVDHSSLPRLIDVLATHRMRSHCPARKDFHILVPHAPSRLTSARLHELKMPATMRASQSVPNFARPAHSSPRAVEAPA